MTTQIYTLETKFNFGKHKGLSLRELIERGEQRYIGYLIFHSVPWFVLDPDTRDLLEEAGVFDDLDMSFPVEGGSMQFNGIWGFEKEEILSLLKNQYEDYISDPIAYEEKARRSSK